MRRTGKDGSAVFESMAAEKVSVGVDPDTLPPGMQVEEGFARVFPMASGDTTRVTVPLREEILLRGKVVLEDGTALDEGLISALAVGDAPSGETVEHGRISAGGAFTIRVRSTRFYRIHEVIWIRHIPKGTGADVEMKLEKLVLVGQQDVRPGTPATVVVRRP